MYKTKQQGGAISVGRTARLQQEKEGRGLVPRVGRNANAGARGYTVSSLSFSPTPHVAGEKSVLSAAETVSCSQK